MSPREWEGLAAELLDATGCDEPPVDAFELAACAGFVVRAASRAALDSERRVIHVDIRARSERQHMGVAHELGHWLLRRSGADSEDGARYLGGALLLPRAAYSADLTRTAWSIGKLRERHVNASATACAVRITQLRDAVVTVLDPRGRLRPWRVVSPWVAEPRLRRVTAWERELARAAYEAGEEVRGDGLCYAAPLTEGARGAEEHRVIVVCEIEQLGLRL